jgi:hypothetical protein
VILSSLLPSLLYREESAAAFSVGIESSTENRWRALVFVSVFTLLQTKEVQHVCKIRERGEAREALHASGLH